MTKETDDIDYSDSLSDFSSLIQQHGATKVAADFGKYFPTQSNEFVHATISVNRARNVAALFKPRELPPA